LRISPSGIQAVRISAPVAYILLYATLYAAFGVASPFWPRFFETRALSPQEIGIVLAAGMLTRLLAGPMVGMLADRAGSLRFALAICTALAAASAAALLWAHSFVLLLSISVIQAASLAPTTSLADASVAGATTSVLALSILQPLHGFTFALLHLASMRMMQTLVPARLAGTGQSIYAFGSGCLTAVLTLLSGTLYAKFGGAAFLPMAVLCVIALPLAWLGFADERRS
jgi:MFS family permease